MTVTRADIEKLAALSRIALTSEETEAMRGEVASILAYVAAIGDISSGTSENARSVIATANVMREDANPHEGGIHTELLLAAAPKREGNYVRVKKIL